MLDRARDQDFWASLYADIRTAGGKTMVEPPSTTTALVDGAFVLTMHVPGFGSPELTVCWGDRWIRVQGVAAPTAGPVPDVSAPRDFVVRCPVPEGFDTSQLRAQLSSGVLAVTVPPKSVVVPVHPAMSLVSARR